MRHFIEPPPEDEEDEDEEEDSFGHPVFCTALGLAC